MPTLTSFKRELKPGMRLRVTNRRYPHLTSEREVIKAQKDSICTTHPEGRSGGSWISYPRAADVVARDGALDFTDDTVDGLPWLTIEVVTP